MSKFFEFFGSRVMGFVEESGKVLLLFIDTLMWAFRPPLSFKSIARHMEEMGINSLPVVLITSIFTGMVLALQSHAGFRKFDAESFVGTVVALSMVREIGPVLAGLMISGRVGAAMAAELGSMKVTEQIDALHTLATNPVQYLVVPRFLAALFVMPVLVIISDIVGIGGGYFISVKVFDSNSITYIRRTWDFLEMKDIYIGLLKAGVFAMIIATISCYQGLYAQGGAEGVGRATTNAVVLSSLTILISNYFLTSLLF